MKEITGQYVLRDLWRFAWPRYNRTRILSEDVLIVQPIADRYGIHIPEGRMLGETKQALGTAGIQEWLDALDGSNGDLTLDSIHAATFLLNTRALAWHAVNGDYIQVEDKQKALDLLAEQVRLTSDMLEAFNQLLLTDKNENSVCSTTEYNENIKEIRAKIAFNMELEKDIIKSCVVLFE